MRLLFPSFSESLISSPGINPCLGFTYTIYLEVVGGPRRVFRVFGASILGRMESFLI